MLERGQERSTERLPQASAAEGTAPPPLTPWADPREYESVTAHGAECSGNALVEEALVDGDVRNALVCEALVDGDVPDDAEGTEEAGGGVHRPPRGPRPAPRRRGRRTVAPDAAATRVRLTPAQRLLALDVWKRSGLDGTEFAPLIGASPYTLYDWKRKFAESGPAGLEDRPRGGRSSDRMCEAVRRSILMTKELHPDWGSERIHHQMARSHGLSASPRAIQQVLEDAGYTVELVETVRHEPPVHRFERAKPNELWQSDLFTFVLRRQNQRVHLVAFLDDHSRFVTSFGLHATASGALVREVFLAGIARYGAPIEVLTDNGTQYKTWRGKSQFTQLCERRGIRQIVARPRHPQTLGKTERMWGTLWRELLETAVFRDIDEARSRVAWFFDHYNFQRSHQGIDGLVPADRYFAAAPEVGATLRQHVAANALELAQHGAPRKPFYLTGRVGDLGVVSLHAEGERVILVGEDGVRAEVDLGAPGRRAERGAAVPPPPLTDHAAPADHAGTRDRAESAPGTSPVDAALAALRKLGDPAAAPKPTSRPDEEGVR